MVPRPALYHPYKSIPSPPAGFRFANYVPRRCFNLFQGFEFANARSPDPSPLNSPVKSARHPEDEPPPTFRFTNLFGGGGPGFSPSPSAPPADGCQKAQPDAHAPAKGSISALLTPRRKVRYSPKRLSFTRSTSRSNTVPYHRRSQQLKDKREAMRRRLHARCERRAARARSGIARLHKEAEVLMKPEHMNAEDWIFMQQLRNLQHDHKMTHDLERCRQRMTRAAAETKERQREHEMRDAEAERLRGEQGKTEAEAEQKQKVEEYVQAEKQRWDALRRQHEEEAMRADTERQRAHEAAERKIREEQERLYREELDRKAKEEEMRRRQEAVLRGLEEERRRLEEECRLREERERQWREEGMRRQRERERKLREEVERLRQAAEKEHRQYEQERKLREEVEDLLREMRERLSKERFAKEEQEREARMRAEQARRAAQDEQIRKHFVLYEAKWNELRTSKSLSPIDIREMPWPVFGVISSVDQITHQGVRHFLFHPLRPGVEGKSARDKVKQEVLRFHPDKFNTRIVPKIQPTQQGVAQGIAGTVARILTTIMAEEVEMQN